MDVVPRKINHKELGLSTKEGCTMDDLDEMTMDIVAEDGASMRKQKKLVNVWDKRKKITSKSTRMKSERTGRGLKTKAGKWSRRIRWARCIRSGNRKRTGTFRKPARLKTRKLERDTIRGRESARPKAAA